MEYFKNSTADYFFGKIPTGKISNYSFDDTLLLFKKFCWITLLENKEKKLLF